MSKWPMVKLGEVIEQSTTLVKGVNPAQETFVTVRNHGRGAVERKIGDGKVPKMTTGYRICAGQFIVSRIDARNGSFALVPEELDGAIVSKDFPVFDVNEAVLSPRFLIEFAKSGRLESMVQALSYGATNRQRVKEEEFLSLRIPLPPLEEQKRIAAILEASAGVNGAVQQKELLTQNLFEIYFRNLISDSNNIRIHASLEDVVDSVIDCPHSTPKWVESGIPCIWTNNIREGHFNWDSPRYVDEATYQSRSSRAYLESGDIVLSREGTVGVAAVIPPGFVGCMGQRLVQVRPEQSILPTSWVLASLLYLLAPERISRFMIGATSKHLNVRDLRNLQIPVPTREALDQFLNFETRLSEMKHDIQEQKVNSVELHQSLAARAFAGEL